MTDNKWDIFPPGSVWWCQTSYLTDDTVTNKPPERMTVVKSNKNFVKFDREDGPEFMLPGLAAELTDFGNRHIALIVHDRALLGVRAWWYAFWPCQTESRLF
jgi:hypothetical protein